MPAFEEVCKDVDDDLRQRTRKALNQRRYRERKKQKMKLLEQEIQRLAKAYQMLQKENVVLKRRLSQTKG